MDSTKKLDIGGIFKDDAATLVQAREKSIKIHGTTDIKAAGNEVEQAVRDYLKRILPRKFYVTQGHLIDMNGTVSPQLDIIISDNDILPSLMTTADGTEYVPIDSVYAIGEIKSTYYKSKKYVDEFSDKIKDIKNNLSHRLIENTAYDGGIHDSTTLQDMVLGKQNKFLNKIFSFILFVDHNDFTFSDVVDFLSNSQRDEVPNVMVFLNDGIISYGRLTGKEPPVIFSRYPDEETNSKSTWFYCPFMADNQTETVEGNVLAWLYFTLLNHLSNSYLEPPNLLDYVRKLLKVKRSGIKYITIANENMSMGEGER